MVQGVQYLQHAGYTAGCSTQPDGGVFDSGMCEHVISFIGCTLTSPEAAANPVLCRHFIMALLDSGELHWCCAHLDRPLSCVLIMIRWQLFKILGAIR